MSITVTQRKSSHLSCCCCCCCCCWSELHLTALNLKWVFWIRSSSRRLWTLPERNRVRIRAVLIQLGLISDGARKKTQEIIACCAHRPVSSTISICCTRQAEDRCCKWTQCRSAAGRQEVDSVFTSLMLGAHTVRAEVQSFPRCWDVVHANTFSLAAAVNLVWDQVVMLWSQQTSCVETSDVSVDDDTSPDFTSTRRIYIFWNNYPSVFL